MLRHWDSLGQDEQVFGDQVIASSPPISHPKIRNFREDGRNKIGRRGGVGGGGAVQRRKPITVNIQLRHSLQ